MKSKGKKPSFTIVELLVVMSIIIILIAMLIPSLNAVRRFARKVTQHSQFHDITNALETFSSRRPEEGYPDSSALDLDGDSYCGAMKLCEVMVGQDGLGLHQDSVFDNMGKDKNGNDLYYNRVATKPTPPYSPAEEQNMRSRDVKYLEGGNAQIVSIETVFPVNYGIFDPCCPVLCDVYKRTDLKNPLTGEKMGMPILYYKADPSKLTHDANEIGAGPLSGTNIYNYWDNHELVEIDVPWLVAPNNKHPMWASDGKSLPFYNNTRDSSVPVVDKPHNQESFILISAGFDGLYGTNDDIFNFTE